MKLFELVHFCGQLPPASRRLIVLISDFLIFYLGFFFAELIIYKSLIYFANLSVVLSSFILPATSIFFIYAFGIYRNKTKFITAKIIPNILFVSFLSSLILFVFDWFFNHAAESKSLVYFYLVTSMLIALRFSVREILNFEYNLSKKNVVIYGAGKIGRQILNAYRFSEEYEPIAIIDNEPALAGKLVSGLPVYKEEDVHFLKKKHDTW